MEIIPAVLAYTFKDVIQKIRLVEPYVRWVQIDVSDGTFTPNVTWNHPKELEGEQFSLHFEAHLMVRDPIPEIQRWAVDGVKRVFVHVEAFANSVQVALAINKAKTAGLEIGLALNPETSIESAEEFIPNVDVVLLLAVAPGFGGQKFNPVVIDKIKKLRQKFPNLDIEIDGGINLETARQCVESGANILAVGSYIFGQKDVKKAIEELKSASRG